MNATRSDSVAGIAEAIYGLILSTAVVAAVSEGENIEVGYVFVTVAVTALVFWLAHVYAHLTAARIVEGERLGAGERRLILRRQAPIMVGAIPALAALALGWTGLISKDTAVDLAIGLGVAALAGCGLVMARRGRLSPLLTILVTAFSGALGLVMVGLKLLVH